MPSVVGPEESRGHRRWVPSSPQVLSHRRRRALCPPSPLELPPMRATVGRLGSHLPRRRARELPATIFRHRVKVVAALMLSSSWRPLVGRFWLSYPTSLPDTSSNRYATPRRHHHETTSAPSPSLPANAASTTPRQAAAGRMKTSRRLRTASLLRRLPRASVVITHVGQSRQGRRGSLTAAAPPAEADVFSLRTHRSVAVSRCKVTGRRPGPPQSRRSTLTVHRVRQ
jgi:hypothetical protein